jgi:hypothetical protein
MTIPHLANGFGDGSRIDSFNATIAMSSYSANSVLASFDKCITSLSVNGAVIVAGNLATVYNSIYTTIAEI